MNVDLLAWLQSYYASRCDGEWEHEHGLKLETLDNPGWLLTVDLSGTGREQEDRLVVREGEPPSEENGQTAQTERWLECYVQDGRFVGACDPMTLGQLLEVFRGWAGPPKAK